MQLNARVWHNSMHGCLCAYHQDVALLISTTKIIACSSISSSEEESEDAWQQKLRENAGFDDFEGGAAEWERSAVPLNYPIHYSKKTDYLYLAMPTRQSSFSFNKKVGTYKMCEGAKLGFAEHI